MWQATDRSQAYRPGGRSRIESKMAFTNGRARAFPVPKLDKEIPVRIRSRFVVLRRICSATAVLTLVGRESLQAKGAPRKIQYVIVIM